MAQKENRRGGDLRQLIVDTIVASRVSSATLKDRAQTQRYLAQYFADVPVEDLQGRSEDIMARIALDHLQFAATRRPGQALVRVFNANEKEHGYTSAHTFIELVNDDMPFLVDSVAAAINRHKMAVHITVHPIISIRRDNQGRVVEIPMPGDEDTRSESFIRFAVDHESDAQQEAATGNCQGTRGRTSSCA